MTTGPVTYATREQFQAELDALSDGEELELHAFEYPGPIVIRHAVTIDGHGATLWSLQGPVCQIESQGVTLKNFKIEVTQEGLANGDTDGGCALHVQGGLSVILENVEVRGSVRGLPAEEGQWHYPFSLKLDEIAHGHEHRFVMKVYVPVPCKISSAVYGINVTPAMLPPGRNEVTLIVESAARDALLLGTLSLQTAFLKRQISVSGHVVQAPQRGSVRQDGDVLYEPADWSRLSPVQTRREPSIPVQKPSIKQPPPPPPAPQPPPSKPAKIEESTSTSEQPPVPNARPSRGTSPSRVIHTTAKISSLFDAPPPVPNEAGSFEPGVRLSSVFDPSPPSPSAHAPQSVDRPSMDTEATHASGVDETDATQMPSLSQATTGGHSKKRARVGSQSIPLGGIFGVEAEPTTLEKNVLAEGADQGTGSQPESVAPRPKRKPQKGSPNVSDVFLR